MDNPYKIADLAEDTHCTLTLISKSNPQSCLVYEFRLYRGSPMRRLFEQQEIWQDGYEEALSRKVK